MSSSYFESLGRRESEPFSYENFNYAETEPDLVEATNKQIDENIKDRKQFFQDKIDAYNQATKNRDKRWTDLAKLTTTGKQIIDAQRKYAEGDNYLENIYKLANDEETVARFIDNEIALEKENNALKVESANEIGIAERTGEWSDGGEATNVDIADFKLAVQEGDFLNGRHAVKEMVIMLPEYLKIAEESLVVDGKFYADMSFSEKQRWRKIAYARYIEMWRDEYDISDRALITQFIPNLNTIEAAWNGSASNTHVDSANQVANEYQVNGYINGVKAEYANSVGDGTDLATVDAIFTGDSYIQQQEAYYSGLGYTDSYKRANDDFLKMIIDNIDRFSEAEIQFLMETYQFIPEGRVDKTTYSRIQTDNALAIKNAWNNHLEEENKENLESQLNFLENQFEIDKTIVTLDQLGPFLSHPELATRANLLYDNVLKYQNLLTKDKFQLQYGTIAGRVDNYLGNTDKWNEYARDDVWKMDKRLAILTEVNKEWDQLYYDYKEQGNNDYVAASLATKEVLKKLDEGGYDKVVTVSEADTTPTNVLIQARDSYQKDWTTTINSSEEHSWETDGKLIENAVGFFARKNSLDPIWGEIAKGYNGVTDMKLAHDRLVALGLLEPIPEFGAIYEGIPKNEINLLTDHNDYALTNRVILSSDENMNIVLNSLIDPKTEDNGGIDAFKTNGEYKEFTGDVKLSEMTVGEILTKIQNNELDLNDELGIYNIRGEAILSLVNNANIDLNRTFDQDTQTLLLLERLRYKTNNRLMFSNSDYTYRRLVNVNEEDREEFKQIIGDLGPFMDLNTLLPIAATELVEQNMPN